MKRFVIEISHLASGPNRTFTVDATSEEDAIEACVDTITPEDGSCFELEIKSDETIVACSVCGHSKTTEEAIEAGWSASWVDAAREERDAICCDCSDLLGLVYVEDWCQLAWPTLHEAVAQKAADFK
jgi:hypothetical protein